MPDLFLHGSGDRMKHRQPHGCGIMFQQFDGKKTRRHMGIRRGPQRVDPPGDCRNGVVDIRAVGQHRHPVILQFGQGLRQFFQQRPDTVGTAPHGADNRGTEIFFEFRDIKFQPFPVGIVGHVEYQHHGNVQFSQLGRQIQAPAGDRGIDDIEDQIDPRLGQFIKHHLFFRR